jgi:hypothetical protein
VTGYRVVLKHLGDGERYAAWYGDKPWTYTQAHDFLIALEQRWPHLHNPGVEFYLSAEPMWRSREHHKAALVSALLEA